MAKHKLSIYRGNKAMSDQKQTWRQIAIEFAQAYRMAHEPRSNWVANATAFAAVLIAGGTAIILYLQLSEAKYEQRPWVEATDVTAVDKIVQTEDIYSIPIKYTIENVGHLPGFYVVPFATAQIVPLGKDTRSLKNPRCDEQRAKAPGDSDGATVFPGQKYEHQGISSEDFPSFSKSEWDALPQGKALMIVGCIDYQVPGSSKHHQSQFAYVVGPPVDHGGIKQVGALPMDPTSIELRTVPLTINNGVPAD